MTDCNFQFKQGSLRDILEELGKLHNAETTRKKVFQQLKTYIQGYCSASYLDAFYKDYGSGYSYSGGGTILLLTQAGEKVSEAILQKASWDGHLDNTHKDHSGCGEKYFNALQACLPKAYAALLFLFFNCDSGCTSFGGGHWNSMQVNRSGTSFYHWLIGGSGSDGFIARKFSGGDLNTSNKGQDVADPLKKAVSLNIQRDDGALQRVLCGFLFVFPWDPALLGHALLFISKFCSEILGDPESFLKDPYKDHSEAFKDVCKGLQSSLQPFISGDSGLSAVCHDNTNLFDTLWDNGKFEDYVKWLKENLHHIIEALQAMSLESSAWNLSSIPHGDTAGPFKYGFVFKASWDGSTSKSKLQGYISKLTGEDSGSLQNFKSFLENPSTPSSTAATAGGVVTGLFGAGGAGAGVAYATNAFGLKDIITGLISGFFK